MDVPVVLTAADFRRSLAVSRARAAGEHFAAGGRRAQLGVSPPVAVTTRPVGRSAARGRRGVEPEGRPATPIARPLQAIQAAGTRSASYSVMCAAMTAWIVNRSRYSVRARSTSSRRPAGVVPRTVEIARARSSESPGS
jgi:hypothetical protein